VNNSGRPQQAQRLLAPEVNEIPVNRDESSIHTVFIPIHRFFIPSQPPETTALQCFIEKKSSIHSGNLEKSRISHLQKLTKKRLTAPKGLINCTSK
jgi:hypothetical protein